MNHQFAAYVTSTAFNLSLSRSMIVCLVDIANNDEYAMGLRIAGLYETTVGTRRKLADRGLIFAPDPKWPGRFELTEAGSLVVELLKVAGLIEAKEKAAA
jgi:hypothetical protein